MEAQNVFYQQHGKITFARKFYFQIRNYMNETSQINTDRIL